MSSNTTNINRKSLALLDSLATKDAEATTQALQESGVDPKVLDAYSLNNYDYFSKYGLSPETQEIKNQADVDKLDSLITTIENDNRSLSKKTWDLGIAASQGAVSGIAGLGNLAVNVGDWLAKPSIYAGQYLAAAALHRANILRNARKPNPFTENNFLSMDEISKTVDPIAGAATTAIANVHNAANDYLNQITSDERQAQKQLSGDLKKLANIGSEYSRENSEASPFISKLKSFGEKAISTVTGEPVDLTNAVKGANRIFDEMANWAKYSSAEDYTDAIANTAGSLLSTGVAGKAVLAGKALVSLGKAKKSLSALTKANIVAGATSVDSSSSAVADIKAMSYEELHQNSPEFDELATGYLQQGYSEEAALSQAKQDIVNAASLQASKLGHGLGLLSAGPELSVLKAFTKPATKAPKGSFVKGVGKYALTGAKGFVDEATEEGLGQAISNYAVKEHANSNKDILEDVGESAIQGGIGGLGANPSVTAAAIATYPFKKAAEESKNIIKERQEKKQFEKTVQDTIAQSEQPINTSSDYSSVLNEATKVTDRGTRDLLKKMGKSPEKQNTVKNISDRLDNLIYGLNAFGESFKPTLKEDGTVDENDHTTEALIDYGNSLIDDPTQSNSAKSESLKKIFTSIDKIKQNRDLLDSELKDIKSQLISNGASEEDVNKYFQSIENSLNNLPNSLNEKIDAFYDKVTPFINESIHILSEDVSNNTVDSFKNSIDTLNRIGIDLLDNINDDFKDDSEESTPFGSINAGKVQRKKILKEISTKEGPTGIKSVLASINAFAHSPEYAKLSDKDKAKVETAYKIYDLLLKNSPYLKNNSSSSAGENVSSWILGGYDNKLNTDFVKGKSIPQHVKSIYNSIIKGDLDTARKQYADLVNFRTSQNNKLKAYEALAKDESLKSATYKAYNPNKKVFYKSTITRENILKSGKDNGYFENTANLIRDDLDIIDKVINDGLSFSFLKNPKSTNKNTSSNNTNNTAKSTVEAVNATLDPSSKESVESTSTPTTSTEKTEETPVNEPVQANKPVEEPVQSKTDAEKATDILNISKDTTKTPGSENTSSNVTNTLETTTNTSAPKADTDNTVNTVLDNKPKTVKNTNTVKKSDSTPKTQEPVTKDTKSNGIQYSNDDSVESNITNSTNTEEVNTIDNSSDSTDTSVTYDDLNNLKNTFKDNSSKYTNEDVKTRLAEVRTILEQLLPTIKHLANFINKLDDNIRGVKKFKANFNDLINELHDSLVKFNSLKEDATLNDIDKPLHSFIEAVSSHLPNMYSIGYNFYKNVPNRNNILSTISSILKLIDSQGYHVESLLNKDYTDDLPAIKKEIYNKSLPVGTRKITKVNKPIITYKGELFQKGDITVSHNIPMDESTLTDKDKFELEHNKTLVNVSPANKPTFESLPSETQSEVDNPNLSQKEIGYRIKDVNQANSDIEEGFTKLFKAVKPKFNEVVEDDSSEDLADTFYKEELDKLGYNKKKESTEDSQKDSSESVEILEDTTEYPSTQEEFNSEEIQEENEELSPGSEILKQESPLSKVKNYIVTTLMNDLGVFYNSLDSKRTALLNTYLDYKNPTSLINTLDKKITEFIYANLSEKAPIKRKGKDTVTFKDMLLDDKPAFKRAITQDSLRVLFEVYIKKDGTKDVRLKREFLEAAVLALLDYIANGKKFDKTNILDFKGNTEDYTVRQAIYDRLLNGELTKAEYLNIINTLNRSSNMNNIQSYMTNSIMNILGIRPNNDENPSDDPAYRVINNLANMTINATILSISSNENAARLVNTVDITTIVPNYAETFYSNSYRLAASQKTFIVIKDHNAAFGKILSEGLTKNPEHRIYVGPLKEKLPISNFIKHSKIKLTRASKKALLNLSYNQKLHLNTDVVTTFSALGEKGLNEFLGNNYDPLTVQVDLQKAKDSRAMEAGRGLNYIEDAMESAEVMVQKHPDKYSSVEDVDIRTTFSMSSVSRLIQDNASGYLNNKVAREALAKSDDVSLEDPAQEEFFKRAIIQGFDIKVNKLSVGKEVDNKFNSVLEATREMALAVYNAAYNKAPLDGKALREHLLNTKLDNNSKLMIEESISPLTIHTLLELGKYIHAVENNQTKFNTSIYLEVDAMQSGPMQEAIQMINNINDMDEGFLIDLAKGGIFLGMNWNGLDASTIDHSSIFKGDMYTSAAKYLPQYFNKLISAVKQTPVDDKISPADKKRTEARMRDLIMSFVTVCSFLGVSIEEGAYLFNSEGYVTNGLNVPRIFTKKGVQQAGYSAGATTITKGTTELLFGALNNLKSEATARFMEYQQKGITLSNGQAFFPEYIPDPNQTYTEQELIALQKEANDKLFQLMNALYLLSSNKVILTSNPDTGSLEGIGLIDRASTSNDKYPYYSNQIMKLIDNFFIPTPETKNISLKGDTKETIQFESTLVAGLSVFVGEPIKEYTNIFNRSAGSFMKEYSTLTNGLATLVIARKNQLADEYINNYNKNHTKPIHTISSKKLKELCERDPYLIALNQGTLRLNKEGAVIKLTKDSDQMVVKKYGNGIESKKMLNQEYAKDRQYINSDNSRYMVEDGLPETAGMPNTVIASGDGTNVIQLLNYSSEENPNGLSEVMYSIFDGHNMHPSEVGKYAEIINKLSLENALSSNLAENIYRMLVPRTIKYKDENGQEHEVEVDLSKELNSLYNDKPLFNGTFSIEDTSQNNEEYSSKRIINEFKSYVQKQFDMLPQNENHLEEIFNDSASYFKVYSNKIKAFHKALKSMPITFDHYSSSGTPFVQNSSVETPGSIDEAIPFAIKFIKYSMENSDNPDMEMAFEQYSKKRELLKDTYSKASEDIVTLSDKELVNYLLTLQKSVSTGYRGTPLLGKDISSIFKNIHENLKGVSINLVNNAEVFNEKSTAANADPKATAFYDVNNNAIYINTSGIIDAKNSKSKSIRSSDVLATDIFHELMHVVTAKVLADNVNKKEQSTLTKEGCELIKAAYNKFMNLSLKDPELQSKLKSRGIDVETLIKTQNQLYEIAKAGAKNGTGYIQALDEFVAYALTEPVLMESLDKIGGAKVTTTLSEVFKNILNGIRNIFGIKRSKDDLSDLSLFRQVFTGVAAITSDVNPGSENSSMNSGPSTLNRINLFSLNDNNLFDDSNKSTQEFKDNITEAINNLVNTAVNNMYTRNTTQKAQEYVIKRTNIEVDSLDKEPINQMKQAGFNFTNKDEYIFNNVYAVFNNINALNIKTSAIVDLHNMYNKLITSDSFKQMSLTKDQIDVLIQSKNNIDSFAAFAALAITNADFKNNIDKVSLKHKELKLYEGAFDNALANSMLNITQDITNKINGNVPSEAINKLVNKILQIQTDKSLDNAANSVLTKLDNKLNAVFDKVIGNTLEKMTSQKVNAEHYINDLGELLIKGSNAVSFLKPFRSIISDMVGSTESSGEFYALVKKAKAKVQRPRELILENIPKFIRSLFTNGISKDSLKELTNYVLKADISVLSNSEINAVMSDPTVVDTRINDLKAKINDKNIIKYATALGKSLISSDNYSLFKNAYTIALAYNKLELESDIDKLATYEALKLLGHNDKLATLVSNNPKAINSIVSYIKARKEDDLNKVNSGNFINNRYNLPKGFTPIKFTSSKHIIFASKDSEEELAKRGYTPIKTSKIYHNGQLYVGSIRGKNILNSGAIQLINSSAGGLSANSLNSTSPFKITEEILFKDINDYNKAHPNSTISYSSIALSDFIQLQKFKPEKYADAVPVFNKDMEVVKYERYFEQKIVDSIPKEDSLDKLIAVWHGRQVEEELATSVNDVVYKHLQKMYDNASPAEKSSQFEDISRSDDPIIKDIFSRLPRQFTTNADGSKKHLFIRKDLINDTIGERVPSIRDIWTGNSRWSPETRKLVKTVLESVLGKKAFIRLSKGEDLLAHFTSNIRNYIVIRSMVVPAINIIANMAQMMNRGIPAKYIAKNIILKTKELNSYLTVEKSIVDLEIKQGMYSPDSYQYKAIQNRINIEKKKIESYSINPLLEAGEFSTIADLGITAEDIDLTSGKFGDLVENVVNKLPDGLKILGKYGIIAKGTPLYTLLEKATQYGDFIAKSIEYDYYTTRPNNKLSPKEAMNKVRDEFVNYDKASGRTRAYFEYIGLAWFLNYALRSVKSGLSMVYNNPFRTLLTVGTLGGLFGLSASPVTDNAITKTFNGGMGNLTGIDSFIGMAENGSSAVPLGYAFSKVF